MNTILTDKYREEYKPVIQELFQHCPEMMARKIPEANVQQAFVFDTVRKLFETRKQFGQDTGTNALCVGSYEDTACESLIKLGYRVAAIDPAVNMDLDTFYAKTPVTFDIIFSTSVIEHVPDDEEFLNKICKLLNPGGNGVLTCDFRNDYKLGDPKPGEDVRLYTKDDLLRRLRNVLIDNNCDIKGKVDYDYAPDFSYGIYTYSFATYTFRKNA